MPRHRRAPLPLPGFACRSWSADLHPPGSGVSLGTATIAVDDWGLVVEVGIVKSNGTLDVRLPPQGPRGDEVDMRCGLSAAIWLDVLRVRASRPATYRDLRQTVLDAVRAHDPDALADETPPASVAPVPRRWTSAA